MTTSIEWWIATGPFDGTGGKVLGPFVSRDLAITVRAYVERVEGHERYWICPLEAGDRSPLSAASLKNSTRKRPIEAGRQT